MFDPDCKALSATQSPVPAPVAAPGILPPSSRGTGGDVHASGTLGLRRITTADRRRHDAREARRWRRRNFWRTRLWEMPLEACLLAARLVARVVPGFNVPMHGRLYLRVVRADGSVLDLGQAGCRLVVTAGKNAIAGAFNNVAPEPELFKFHALGTGATAPAAGDTALQTELTTAYNPDSTRATGTQANSTNTYTTVGTNTVDATAAVTEWGLLTQAATGGGTLLDRQTFAAVNLASGDSLQTTYVFTVN